MKGIWQKCESLKDVIIAQLRTLARGLEAQGPALLRRNEAPGPGDGVGVGGGGEVSISLPPAPNLTS